MPWDTQRSLGSREEETGTQRGPSGCQDQFRADRTVSLLSVPQRCPAPLPLWTSALSLPNPRPSTSPSSSFKWQLLIRESLAWNPHLGGSPPPPPIQHTPWQRYTHFLHLPHLSYSAHQCLGSNQEAKPGEDTARDTVSGPPAPAQAMGVGG